MNQLFVQYILTRERGSTYQIQRYIELSYISISGVGLSRVEKALSWHELIVFRIGVRNELELSDSLSNFG